MKGGWDGEEIKGGRKEEEGDKRGMIGDRRLYEEYSHHPINTTTSIQLHVHLHMSTLPVSMYLLRSCMNTHKYTGTVV